VAAEADWAGVVHPRAKAGARIASLVPSLTETLFALGLGDDVVARTAFCTRPRDRVKRVPKVGGTKDPGLDRLRALAPTHLVVNVDENRREDVDAARAFVPHVIVTHPEAPDDNPRLYRLLGATFGCEDAAASLTAGFERARASMVEAVRAWPRERVLYLIWRRPWMTVSPGTYVANALALAGWDVVRTGSRRYPEVGEDDPAWKEADRILLSTEPYAFVPRDVEALARATGKPVHLVDGEWTSWYGVRAIAGIGSLAAFRAACAAGPPPPTAARGRSS
jgi:ABC-type Fe3+-hydroxamate transport system substrate-binding protein